MNGGVFNVNHNGMIYTERKQSTKIKYLKTLEDYDDKDKTNDKYTLYGNTQDNKIECADKKECIIYGSSGNDEFYQTYIDEIFTIKDFKGNNGDGDKLFLRNDISGLRAERGENGMVNIILMDGGDKNPYDAGKITLKGPGYEEVGRWVDMINNPDEYESQDRIKNPIKFNTLNL